MRDFTFFNFAFFFFIAAVHGSSVDVKPLSVICNPNPKYTLINSVDFHPYQNHFCVTYSNRNKIGIYELDNEGNVTLKQFLKNPKAKLLAPQHAIFSSDGNQLLVANWTTGTLNFYDYNDSLCSEKPDTIIAPADECTKFKPHGMTISPTGNYLAIAYGASNEFPTAIGLYRIEMDKNRVVLITIAQDSKVVPGIPKGITFCPDGRCLLVTFSDINAIVIYSIENDSLKPLQVVQGPLTKLLRPEDIKISPDGNYCAVTNSGAHNITFYKFDKLSNLITQDSPVYMLEGPLSNFCIPHGIAFSSDGAFLAITEFGHLTFLPNEDIYWDVNIKPEESKIKIFRTDFLKIP